MLTPSANLHRSSLPKLGAIVTMPGLAALSGYTLPMRRGYCRPSFRRFIVESFPLNDSADSRYSCGIHTVTVRALDNGEARRVAGHWCEEAC